MSKEDALKTVKRNRGIGRKSNSNIQYEFSMDEIANMLIECEDACRHWGCGYDYQVTEMKLVGLTPQQLYDKYNKN